MSLYDYNPQKARYELRLQLEHLDEAGVGIFCFCCRTDGRLGASWCPRRIGGSRSRRQNLTFTAQLTALRSPSPFLHVLYSPCILHGRFTRTQKLSRPTDYPLYTRPHSSQPFPQLLLSHVMREKRCSVVFYSVITKRSGGRKVFLLVCAVDEGEQGLTAVYENGMKQTRLSPNIPHMVFYRASSATEGI